MVKMELTAEDDIEKDYVDLFSYVRESHLAKYVYFFRPHIYDDLEKDESYYPFHLECALINDENDSVFDILFDVQHAIEIGPGSSAPVKAKTLPTLQKLFSWGSLTDYTAIDLNEGYARGACAAVKNILPHMITNAICLDFLEPLAFEHLRKSYDRDNRLYFSFGQTIFSNNNEADIDYLLSNIATQLRSHDYFMFGVDLSDDTNALALAYDTEVSHQLAFNTMHFFKQKFALSDFDPEGFTPMYQWNEGESRVEILLKSKFSQQFTLNKNFLTINKDSLFNIYSSKKYDINKVTTYLHRHQLRIVKIKKAHNALGNQYALIIAQKNNI